MIIKNSNIRRSIFENRYVIFVVIFGIILALYLIRVLNEDAKERLKPQNNEIQNTVITQPKEDTSNKPIISGTEVNKQEQEDTTKLIETFVTYCNNKEIEKAYALLSEECKTEVFSSNIQYFQKNYVEKIFTTKKMVDIQAWMNSYMNTYQVKIMDDMLSSGKITSSQDAIEDYYTIVTKGTTNRLNINGYIGRQQIESKTAINGITITVLCKDIYKDYESYDIQVGNTSLHTILLDSQEELRSSYLVGTNESKYYAFLYEVDKHDMIVEPNKTKTITIRFNKIYSNQAVMRKMVFSDIITNYEEYELAQDKKQYTNRTNFTIEL